MQGVQTLPSVALKHPVSINSHFRLAAKVKKQVFRMRLTVDILLITMCA